MCKMANALEGVLQQLNDGFDFEKESASYFANELFQKVNNYMAKVKKAAEVYKETGEIPKYFYDNWEDSDDIENENEATTEKASRRSIKENIEPNKDEGIKSRPRRNAFKEATENINTQYSNSLSSKLRRPENLTDPFQNIYIKKEKRSTTSISSETSEVKVKTEAEEMPAPTRPAPRKKRAKKTSIQVKQEKIEEYERRPDSDIIIQDQPVPLVDIADSDEGEKTVKNEEPEENVRSTRTKTRTKKKLKRTRTKSSDEESDHNKEKRSKSGSNATTNCNITSETQYEDAVSTVEENVPKDNDATYIATAPRDEKEKNKFNATVVVENPKFLNNNMDALITDDESEDENKKPAPPKTTTKSVSKSKPVFSPFEPSPVKKKVQAFEKLTEQATAIPVIRVTRTKTRANTKKQEEEAQSEAEVITKTNVKEKAKLFTPVTSKFVPGASSTVLISKKLPSHSNESIISAKSASALKASQAEYREREKKRREKEAEALKKRDALLQAQIEEKRRKREEKQLKAQQQREALEKEKLKALEAQRLKDERHKQLIAEQEERKQKQREEMEKKRVMAKMRAVEEKKKEEERRLEEQKEANELTAKLAKREEEIARLALQQKMQKQQEKKVPIYMKTKAPLLPTEDCYDSDDEEFSSTSKAPLWTHKDKVDQTLRVMMACGEALKNTFFSRQAQTPDLQDIFEVIDSQKLKRSSSAVWHKPPRYTMMPVMPNHDEISEDDE